jgi:L-iditol 2-dehydrogenase
MQALVKTAPGVGNLEIRDIEEPKTPPGHVKIAVRAAGICGTDLHIYHDEYRSYPPVVLGHEVAGEVAEIGPGVERVRVGEPVTTETYASTCGSCRYCREGRANLCPERRSIGSGVNGGFTTYVVVPEHNIHRLPENVSFAEGALTEPLACVVHAALETAMVTSGDVAVVAGPGAIGLLTLQVVKAAGARAIMLGTDVDEHRLRVARDLGADAAVNVQRDDYRAAVEAATDADGADIVYECSGAGPAAQTLLELVRRGGRYAQIGLFGKPVSWDLDQIVLKELTVTGSFASTPPSWVRALRLMAEGSVRLSPLISDTFPITQWRSAFDIVEGRSGLKTLLTPVEEGAP